MSTVQCKSLHIKHSSDTQMAIQAGIIHFREMAVIHCVNVVQHEFISVLDSSYSCVFFLVKVISRGSKLMQNKFVYL